MRAARILRTVNRSTNEKGKPMTNTIHNITSAFDAMIPAIADDYRNEVRRQFDRLIEKHGNGRGLNQLSGSWCRDGGVWRGMVRHNAKHVGDGPSFRQDTDYEINSDRLDRNAAQYAADAVAGFVAKLIRKLGDLSDVSIADMNTSAGTFTIGGKIGGRWIAGEYVGQKVTVNQRCILKCSNKGTLFNQWPARIYVDGVFTPEKKFKELAA